uniref:Uncharacterized protein n=1 Tax=Arundo donax TaxID=35708 RepID=A0A0A9HUF2_ARUDO
MLMLPDRVGRRFRSSEVPFSFFSTKFL